MYSGTWIAKTAVAQTPLMSRTIFAVTSLIFITEFKLNNSNTPLARTVFFGPLAVQAIKFDCTCLLKFVAPQLYWMVKYSIVPADLFTWLFCQKI